ncbi:MAG: glycerophosphodiester phosphodiesterase family protein, partial [Candidatus Sumerlaeota bacterium]|nr:glycerophosphodiester phosphodiesterase family protein [Candidatus Sumerlaeota bacterium]
ECRRRAPRIPLTHLFGEPPGDAIERTRAAGAETISIDHRKANAGHVAAARDAGLRVALWTVNAEEDLCRALDLGADCLTSDRPDLLLRWLGRI